MSSSSNGSFPLRRYKISIKKRYYCALVPSTDKERALNTLRYIHANPKAAGMRQGFFYDFSNYGTYDRLTDDGLTQWHPAFLQLGKCLDECAKKYRGFCQRYKPKVKSASSKSHWGSKLLADKLICGKGKGKQFSSPGQLALLPECQVWEESQEVHYLIERLTKDESGR